MQLFSDVDNAYYFVINQICLKSYEVFIVRTTHLIPTHFKFYTHLINIVGAFDRFGIVCTKSYY